MSANHYRFYSNHLFQFLLFCLPLCLLLWTPGVWVVQILLLLIWFLGLQTNHRNYIKKIKTLKDVGLHKYLFSVIIGYFIWSALSVVVLKSPLQSIDNAVIFLLWYLTMPLLIDLKPSSNSLGYGCLLALVVGLVIALTQFHVLNLTRAIGFYGSGKTGSGAIKFGDMSLLFGVLTLLLFSGRPDNKIVGLLGAFLGVLICIYASSRGGLLAIFLSMLMWQLTLRRERYSRTHWFLLVFASAAMLYCLNWIMSNFLFERVQETKAEVDDILALKFSSPMGIRMHLWYAAILMFMENPMLGVGLNNFGNALKSLYQMNLISDDAVRYAHAHNEFLCALATGGIVGFVLTLLLFVLPIMIFRQDYQHNVWAKSGFWGVSLMCFFSLTDCIFDRRMTVMAFIVVIAVCMAGNLSLKAQKNAC